MPRSISGNLPQQFEMDAPTSDAEIHTRRLLATLRLQLQRPFTRYRAARQGPTLRPPKARSCGRPGASPPGANEPRSDDPAASPGPLLRSRSSTAWRCPQRNLWRRTLKKRSQKDETTWDRITKLTDDWLPKPRILHPWPRQRFAVKHPRWEPEPFARNESVRLSSRYGTKKSQYAVGH
jgi:hypothetical protein